MLASNLAAFRSKFDGLLQRLHKLAEQFGEVGRSDAERERGEDTRRHLLPSTFLMLSTFLIWQALC